MTTWTRIGFGLLAFLIAVVQASASEAGDGLRLADRQMGVAPLVKSSTRQRSAEENLEAVTLQVLLAPMLTSGGGRRYFSTGNAGRHWQAMMSEHVARTIAASGRIGLMGRSSASRPFRKREGGARVLVSRSASGCAGGGCATSRPWQTTITPGPGQALPRWFTLRGHRVE